MKKPYDLEPDPVLVRLSDYRKCVDKLGWVLQQRFYGYIDCEEAVKLLDKTYKGIKKKLG